MVTIEPRTGLSPHNTPLYGAAYTVQARVEFNPKMIRNREGREVISNATIYLAVAYTVHPYDRITLPDGSQPPILHVYSLPDTLGTFLVTVYV